MRDLARLGRSRCRSSRFAASAATSASRHPSVTDATSIGDGLAPRPRAASSRPGTYDLMASTISAMRGMRA
jgi:hypothetical protein